MQLRSGLRVLRRARDEVQIGTDPRWAIRLTGLTAAEVHLLVQLEGPTSARVLRLRARALGVPPDRLESLLAVLEDALLMTRASGRRPAGPRLSPRAAPDAAVWTRALDGGDGERFVAARRDRVVGLISAGRLGLTAAVTLAAAGIGTVLVDDAADVTPADLGVGGYTARHVGTPRREAAAQVLRDVAPEVRTTAPSGARPDVVVVVEHHVADSLRARVLMTAGVVHLSVVVREADVQVGPLVRPGQSPCLRCLDLHRADADGGWPSVAVQLISAATTHPAEEETLLAAIAGALAAGQVLAELDGMTPSTLGAAFEIGLPGAAPSVRRWPAHPRCGCVGLPG